MISQDEAHESVGMDIELGTRYSEVVGANVNEQDLDATVMDSVPVPSKEEEPWAREDDTKMYLSKFLTTAPALSFVDGEKKKNDDGNVLINIGTTSIGGEKTNVICFVDGEKKKHDDGSVLLTIGPTSIDGEKKAVICYDAITKIIEFAASTTGDVYVLSQTCKKWNSIINKIPNTANPIWYKIARRFYGRQDIRRLESMVCGCEHDSKWKMLLYIESVAKLSIFHGQVGQILKLLVWVFGSHNIIPYKLITWKEESEHNGVCKVVKTTEYAEGYWQSLGVINDNTRERGIDRFDVDFSEESYLENLKDKCVLVHYLDHPYIIANFVSECRIIDRWFQVFGFYEGEYCIYPPKAVKEGPLKGYEGYFRVIIRKDCNWFTATLRK